MTVYWTDAAVDNLDNVYKYIAQTSPEYAKRVIDRITRRSEQIAEYPESGRKVPGFAFDQIREIIETPYRIIYYIKPDRIDVLAVIHGAQNI